MSARVVFDTSTLIGAAVRPDSIPDRALQCAMGSHELFASAETLGELERVLKKKRLNRYLKLEDRLLFAQTIRHNATKVAPAAMDLDSVRGACRDATEEKFLALSLAANADILVSSDQDLLVLHPWRGIAIMTPAKFVEQFTI
jgi:uncharacterized protein